MKKLKSLYISSVLPSSGKTEIALGLGMVLQDKGYKVGYFKPFGSRKGKANIDPEIEILAKAFGMDETSLCPCFLDAVHFETILKQDQEKAKKQLLDSYNAVRDTYDVVIIEGLKKANTLLSFDLDDANLARMFDDSPILAVDVLEVDDDIDDVLLHKNIITHREGNYAGCVLNKIPKIMSARAEKDVLSFLKEKGCNLLGMVQRDDRLTAPTMGEIMENLNGKLLDDDIDSYNFESIVQHVLIGAMSAHSALSYFRSSGKNSIVITGGDRADIVLTALETNISGIILTGNLYPDVRVLAAAKEKNVPVIMVPYDTYTTASKVSETAAELQLHEKDLCKELVEKSLDIDGIIELLKK